MVVNGQTNRGHTALPQLVYRSQALRTRVLVCCIHGTPQSRYSDLAQLNSARKPLVATYQTRISHCGDTERLLACSTVCLRRALRPRTAEAVRRGCDQLVGLEADIAEGVVRLCFGSRRLWRKQHDLEANGYASHAEWLRDWRDARSDEFFVWVAGMKRQAVSSASPVLPMTAR